MSTLRLAGPDDLDKLETMVAAFHAHQSITQDSETRRAALSPLLDGSAHGAIWLIGPRSSPVGYVAVSFGWSIELGGTNATIDELFIREKVRGRGMGSEAISHLAQALAGQGVQALHLEVSRDNDRALAFVRRAHFSSRDGYLSLARML